MKRFICLFFALVMLLTLTACGNSQEKELLNKYSGLLNDLENKNFDSAIGQIQSMAAADAATAPTTEPTYSQEELMWQDKVTGTWFPDEAASEEGYTGFTINEDGTCTLDGVEYSWTMDYASESSTTLIIWEEQTKKNSISFSISSDYGYTSASLSVCLDEHSTTSTNGNYFNEKEYNIVKITKDNWKDYFEVVEILSLGTNSFDEVDTFRGNYYLRLKESYGKINNRISSVAIEYSGVSLCQDITVDLKKVSYTPVGDVHNTSEYESTKQLSSSTDVEGNWYYGTSVGSFSLSNVDKELTGTVWRPTDTKISRIQGTIYIIK